MSKPLAFMISGRLTHRFCKIVADYPVRWFYKCNLSTGIRAEPFLAVMGSVDEIHRVRCHPAVAFAVGDLPLTHAVNHYKVMGDCLFVPFLTPVGLISAPMTKPLFLADCRTSPLGISASKPSSSIGISSFSRMVCGNSRTGLSIQQVDNLCI